MAKNLLIWNMPAKVLLRSYFQRYEKFPEMISLLEVLLKRSWFDNVVWLDESHVTTWVSFLGTEHESIEFCFGPMKEGDRLFVVHHPYGNKTKHQNLTAIEAIVLLDEYAKPFE